MLTTFGSTVKQGVASSRYVSPLFLAMVMMPAAGGSVSVSFHLTA
jgi:hypothetical protein